MKVNSFLTSKSNGVWLFQPFLVIPIHKYNLERVNIMAFKKTSIIVSMLLSSAIWLGACGEQSEVTKDTTNNDTKDDIKDSAPGDNPADLVGETYGFTHFELEVDTADQEEAIDVNYEEAKDSTEAEYTNTAEKLDQTGDEAMAHLEPIFESLALNAKMTDEEIVEKIVKEFNIDEAYKEIEVDITWLDEEKRKINVTK